MSGSIHRAQRVVFECVSTAPRDVPTSSQEMGCYEIIDYNLFLKFYESLIAMILRSHSILILPCTSLSAPMCVPFSQLGALAKLLEGFARRRASHRQARTLSAWVFGVCHILHYIGKDNRVREV